MKHPTQDRIKQLVLYNPLTGEFVRKEKPASEFATHRICEYWNRRYANKPAGYLCGDGYHYLMIDGRRYAAHRLAWIYFYGQVPQQIDHENGDTSDNRIANLRDVSNLENSRNQKLRCTNRSGVTGIAWIDERWLAYIYVKGRFCRLGSFASFEAAVKTRKQAETHYGFHRNHGRTV